jgi:hypothetical protein
MSIPSLQQLCSNNLCENCENIDDIFKDNLIPIHVKKSILNAGEWYCNEISVKHRNQYEFRKRDVQESKIQRISFNIFNISGNQRLEVSVNTNKLDVYFDLIRRAQESNKNQYLFDSLHRHFPKDSNGFCTVEAVQNWRSRLGEKSFDLAYLDCPLIYCSRFNTREELTKKIYEICTIFQQTDSTTEALTKYLQLDFSVSVFKIT